MQTAGARLLPWSPAMAALFIDPTELAQGSLLGGSRNTFLGTYTQDMGGVSHSMQVSMWSHAIGMWMRHHVACL